MFLFSCFLFFDIKTAPFAGAEAALNWGQPGIKENGSTNLSQNGSVNRGADSLSSVDHIGSFIDAATVSLGLIQTKLTKWPCMESNQLHGPYSRIGTLGLKHFIFQLFYSVYSYGLMRFRNIEALLKTGHNNMLLQFKESRKKLASSLVVYEYRHSKFCKCLKTVHDIS